MRKIKENNYSLVYDIGDKGRECARKHHKDIFESAFNNKRYIHYFDKADISISKKVNPKADILCKTFHSNPLLEQIIGRKYNIDDYGDEDMDQFEMENTLNDTLSNFFSDFGTMKSRIKNNISKQICIKMKNHFGCSLSFLTKNDITEILGIIKSYDKSGKINSINLDYDDNCGGPYIIKLRQDTYVYIPFYSYNYMKKFVIYIFGKKAYAYRSLFIKLMQDKSDKYTNNFMIQYSPNSQDDWLCTSKSINKRKFDTLFFDNHISDDIKSYLDEWKSNEKMYKDKGIIFKTGILLYGEPGTGKSTLALAIADYLNYDLITINLNNFSKLQIGSITSAIDNDSSNYVILFDEIDTLFSNRDEDIDQNHKEAISNLLAFLDSPLSPNNVVFVATTNYIDRLDKAVIRKGRFDKAIEIKNISYNTAVKMCKSFGLSASEVNNILKDEKGLYNPASLQSKILEIMKSRLENS